MSFSLKFCLNYAVLFDFRSPGILYHVTSCDKFLIKKNVKIYMYLVFLRVQFSTAFDILNVGRQMWAIRNGRVAKPIRGGPEDVCANNRRKKCPMKEIYGWH